MQKIICLLLILALSLCLCACSAKSSMSPQVQTMAAAPEAGNESTYSKDMIGEEQQTANNATGVQGETTLNIGAADNRKIIYEAHLRLEAIDFDKATSSILQQLQELKGYVSSSSIEGQKGENNRYAEYVIRIPQPNYNKMLSVIPQFSNVLSQSENAQDITTEYIDIEARLKSLKTQEERLLEMMKSAGELETLLAVQNQLADVQYRIESITAQKNTYDKLTQYATLNITITEVSRITETQKDTFFQRIGVAFRESWIGFADTVQELIIAFVYLLPLIIIFAVVVMAVIIVALKAKKRKPKSANQAAEEAKPKE